jgi:hypothetical protein
VGGEWRFNARDELATARATYQLVDVENERTLWQQSVSERTPVYTLRVTEIYPNPARDNVRIAVDSPQDARASLAVYDVTGRLVSRDAATMSRPLLASIRPSATWLTNPPLELACTLPCVERIPHVSGLLSPSVSSTPLACHA